MITTQPKPVAASSAIALDERIMQELLEAARDPGVVDLSLPAIVEIETIRARCGTAVANWSAVYLRAAAQLRDRCIRMGMPRRRYQARKWVQLGLIP
jgi:hypothetical protein